MGQLNASSTKRQGWWLTTLGLIPAVLTLVFLMVNQSGLVNDSDLQFLSQVPIPLMVLIASAILLWLSGRRRAHSSRLRFAAFLVPCFLAPLALLYPWTIAPSHLSGISWGGARFFLHWLTKYPNFGPVNLEVLAGIAAMLCLGFLPVLFGVLALRRSRLMALISIVCVIWIAYVPIIIRLDSNLILAGLIGTADHSVLFLMYGPIIRLMAAIATLALLVFYHKKGISIKKQ